MREGEGVLFTSLTLLFYTEGTRGQRSVLYTFYIHVYNVYKLLANILQGAKTSLLNF